jgi:hypothetical protein
MRSFSTDVEKNVQNPSPEQLCSGMGLFGPRFNNPFIFNKIAQ